MFLSKKTILYFVPHPGDELAVMGADIRMSVARGHNVHVILCTRSDPAADEAFRESCLRLGVKPLNIHRPNSREASGNLTLQYAEKLIRTHPILWDRSAVVCTVARSTAPEQHPDHKMLGRAAENQLQRGLIRELRLFDEPGLSGSRPARSGLEASEPVTRTLPERQLSRLRSAAAAYPQSPAADAQCSYVLLRTTGAAPKPQNKKDLLFYSSGCCPAPALGDWKLVYLPARDTDAYRSFCEPYPDLLTEKNLQRIADGSSFWGLVSRDGEVAASGWLAFRQSFYIGEADYGFHMDQSETALLYALGTSETFRGAGLYPLLLTAIASHPEGHERLLVFATAGNTDMQADFLEAGFTCDGTLSAEDGSLPNYLEKQGFTGLYRKKQ